MFHCIFHKIKPTVQIETLDSISQRVVMVNHCCQLFWFWSHHRRCSSVSDFQKGLTYSKCVWLHPMKQGPRLNTKRKRRKPADHQNSSLSTSCLQSQCGPLPVALVQVLSLLDCCPWNCEPLKLRLSGAFITAARKVTNTVVWISLTV